MTYGELKDFVLQLLNRYSIAGSTIDHSYNDQADIIGRIPALVRDGLHYMATTCRRLREVAPLSHPEKVGAYLLYQLPDDCYQLCGGLLHLQPDGDVTRYRRYRLVGGRQLLVPAQDKGTFMVEYFRYPCVQGGIPADEDFLDCPPEAQTALAYYVAAHLAMEDNNYLHAALHNEFEMKMLRLQEGQLAECGVVEDVYG
ncbi:MAG: hypothetical protein J6J43_06555 [Oscillospiraceae bacterium]|nr:hypothetical protein [Oscillospiraceae bacterium]